MSLGMSTSTTALKRTRLPSLATCPGDRRDGTADTPSDPAQAPTRGDLLTLLQRQTNSRHQHTLQLADHHPAPTKPSVAITGRERAGLPFHPVCLYWRTAQRKTLWTQKTYPEVGTELS
jgi:hypothetical protein